MKLIKNIYLLGLLIGLVAFTGCSEDDLIEPTPSPEIPAGNQGVYFPASNKSAFEILTEDPAEIEITIARNASEGAVDVPITQEVNDDNVFNVPASVSFAAGEKETTFKVTFPDAVVDKAYNLKLNVSGDQYVNPYVEGVPYVATKVTVSEPEDWVWEPIEVVYIEGGFSSIWEKIEQVPFYVQGEKGTLGNQVRYRLKNIYNRVLTSAEPDEDGIYSEFPYIGTEFIDVDKDVITTLQVGGTVGEEVLAANEVFMAYYDTGLIDFNGCGPVSMGSVFGNFANVDKAENPLGTIKDGIIRFPEKSLIYSDDDGNFTQGKPTTIYLSKEIFDADNKSIKDFNDLEYEVIEGEESTFVSNAYGDSWSQSIAKAIDKDEENPDSAFKNLFFLSDLYSEGKGVAFYYDEESGDVTIPENQPIGTQVFGQDLYVSGSETIESSVEVKDNGLTEYTLGMIFHYEDGTIVGDFAERYLYSEDPISYDIGDFVGNFTMTGFSLFQGEDDALMDVKIAEGEGENELVITGVDLAAEIVATFDPLTEMISIAPQALADFGAYDISLLTVTLEGSSLSISETAIINLQRNIVGDVILDSYSEAIGYVLESQAADGYVDGYYDIEFTPRAAASSTSVQNSSAIKVQSALTTTVKEDNAKTHNFKVQGKKSTRQNQKMVKNEQIYYIFR